MSQAKLSSKYQLSIPKEIRQEMDLEAGQQFTIITRGNIIELIPLRSMASARGLLADCKYANSNDYRDRQQRQ
ncbi:MAG: AbrB family looped-hinge helix DNA binding protein [Phenylobacterium sp.]|jgi:AbrB family looped-hinge helix DNA binding protein